MYVFLSKSNLSDFKILVVLLFKSLTCRYTKGYHFFYMYSTGCKMSKIWPGVFVNSINYQEINNSRTPISWIIFDWTVSGYLDSC